MTTAINTNAKSERELTEIMSNTSDELRTDELEAVSGGMLFLSCLPRKEEMGQNDPAQMFQQIMQQMTQGG